MKLNWFRYWCLLFVLLLLKRTNFLKVSLKQCRWHISSIGTYSYQSWAGMKHNIYIIGMLKVAGGSVYSIGLYDRLVGKPWLMVKKKHKQDQIIVTVNKCLLQMCYAQSIMIKATWITNLHDSKDKMNIQNMNGLILQHFRSIMVRLSACDEKRKHGALFLKAQSQGACLKQSGNTCAT